MAKPKLQLKPQLIGQQFHVDDSLDVGNGYEHYEGMITIGGYVYYDNMLYYTCVTENGDTVDMHYQEIEDML